MATDQPSAKTREISLEVNVTLRDALKSDLRPDLHVYAFASSGRLYSQTPIAIEGRTTDASALRGTAKLRVPAAGTTLVLVGPAVDGAATLAELGRLGALEQPVRPGTVETSPNLTVDFTVWEPDWRRWFLNACCARGHVVKAVGDHMLGVCDATVEVYEVDPIFILVPQLPDRLIDLLAQIAVEIPFPLGGPIGPDPGPETLALARRISTASTSSLALSESVRGRLSEFFPNPEDPNEPHGPGGPISRLQGILQALPAKSLAVARSGNLTQFRQELILNPDVVRFILCLLYPRWVSIRKVGQGKTGCDGKFSVCFYQSPFNPDKPDLWFKVTQNVPGHGTVVIYERYPIACNTYWNHPCASEVTLVTTNPLAYTCACDPRVDHDGNWVLLDQIGGIFASQIRGMSPALEASTNASNLGLIGDTLSFAGTLDPILYFSDALTAAGVKYRVSYQKDGAASPTVLIPAISRSYLYTAGGTAHWGTYPLGPNAELYDCRPAAPPQGTWEVQGAGDRAATHFDTIGRLPAGDHGVYRLRIEVFKHDGAPLALNDPALGFKFLLGSGVDGPQNEAWPALLDGNTLVVPVFVDLRPCHAALAAPFLPTGTAGTACGGLTFHDADLGSSLTMPYTAHRDGGLFRFSWSIVRGQGNPILVPSGSGSVALGASGAPIPPAVASPNPVVATMGDLLGPCPSGAAFAINLDVRAQSTDGYGPVEFPAGATFAFMLNKA